MKILGYILALIVLVSFLFGWTFYRDEMKSFVGIPIVPKVEKVPAGNDAKVRVPGTVTSEPESTPATPESENILKKDTIGQLLAQRYPEFIPVPFDEKFPSVQDLTESILPDRIQIREPVNFTLRQGDSLLAASFVKSGGMVLPLKIQADGETLEICSLANSDLKSVIPFSQTDLLEQIKNRYEESQQKAASRIQGIRETDAYLLESHSHIFSELKKDPLHWDAHDSPGYRRHLESIQTRLDPNTHRVTGFFTEGKTHIEMEDLSGTFVTVTARIEGTDYGFGPYLWRARGIVDKGVVIKWTGLPE